MDYLRQNLNNSKILPYDIMYEIYQYADPMYTILESIKNKNYDLDSIMYKRMLNHINKLLPPYANYILGSPYREHYFIDRNNMNDEQFKYYMIYEDHGYKHVFFYNFRRIDYIICGLDSRESNFNKYKMICDLEYIYKQNIYDNFLSKLSIKELYQLWCKL